MASGSHVKTEFKRRRIILVLILLLGAGIGVFFFLRGPDADSLVRQGRQRLNAKAYEESLSYAEQALERDPANPAALVLAGDAWFAMEKYDQALQYYRKVPEGSSEESVHARFRCARIEFHHLGNVMLAEQNFRAGLKHAPHHRNGLLQLVGLLGIQARQREAIPFILRLFRQGEFNKDFLGLLMGENSALFNLEELRRYQKVTPNHAGILVGLAWHERKSGNVEKALRLLKQAMESQPDMEEARVMLATLLWDLKRYQELQRLFAEDLTRAVDDSRLWMIRGRLAEQLGQQAASERCFWEAWRRHPNDRDASYRVYRYLLRKQDKQNLTRIQNHLKGLQELREANDRVASTKKPSSQSLRELVTLLEKNGQCWAAWGWSVFARETVPDATWALSRAENLFRKLKLAPLKTDCRENPLLVLDLSHLPLPEWKSKGSGSEKKLDPSLRLVSFRDASNSAGIRFRYFNSPSPAGKGQKMYEFNGGGCAVLDYDQDGWPDLYFTQGCRWPVREGQTEHIDRLFRNLGNGRFEDVTETAFVLENRYSTGVTVGDYDCDGFPDLYVANIGGNRLLRNNGDGTFHDITRVAGVEDLRWSTSCVMADLNGDSLPDIYSVNYLEGQSLFERVCQHADGTPRMCMPFHFPGAQDQLFLNLGDGRFKNVTEISGLKISNGKGLGVVAADWQGNGRLSLFVANDTVGNFLFVNKGPDENGLPRFSESGLASGVALNEEGKAEGCMGIAVGDANNDGTLDLFVTNFLNETNTLYNFQGGLLFEDRTRRQGLAEPSRQMLGFGTQFLDADLDGDLDLIVANGHIDDYRKYGRPYKMQAQVFVNDGQGRFTELAAVKVGDYFQRKVLGRGLARLDWNRDGREDVVISHLDEPAVLLTNTTNTDGQFVSFHLRGVRSSRDAVGATVILQTDRRSMTRQLTAGDGYQASNQRVLIFGLKDSERIQRVEVRWPSSEKTELKTIRAGREYLILQGRTSPIELPLSR